MHKNVGLRAGTRRNGTLQYAITSKEFNMNKILNGMIAALAATLILHIIFGMVLGAVFGKLAARTA